VHGSSHDGMVMYGVRSLALHAFIRVKEHVVHRWWQTIMCDLITYCGCWVYRCLLGICKVGCVKGGKELGVVPGEITPSYILHTRAFGTYLLGGLFTFEKKIIR
jgi:hypothetical protein